MNRAKVEPTALTMGESTRDSVELAPSDMSRTTVLGSLSESVVPMTLGCAPAATQM